MVMRFSAIVAVLLVGLLALWLCWFRPVDTAPVLMEETVRPAAAAPNDHATEIDTPIEVTQTTPPRESAAVDATEAGIADASPLAEVTATLVVTTTNRANGALLPGIRVTVLPQQPVSSAGSTHVVGSKGTLVTSPITATDGRVEFELPVGVEFNLSASAEDGNAGYVHRDIAALKPGERREIRLDLPTGFDIHYFGRVLAREDRHPLAGASIELLRAERWTTWTADDVRVEHSKETLLAEHRADAEGRFDLWLPSWKNPDLQVEAPGYAPVFLEVGTDHDVPERARDVLLSRSASLRVRLLDAGGVPLPDGAVRLWTESYHLGESDRGQVFLPSAGDPEWKGNADSTGVCLLQDLPPEVPLHVEVFRGTDRVREDLPPISLNPGEAREVEWTIGSGCSLSGTVTDQHGEVVKLGTIWLQRADIAAPRIFEEFHSGEVVLEQNTDTEGRFVFSDVSPGSWWIGPSPANDDIAPFAEVIEVLIGSSRQELVLHVHRGLYIRGVVLRPTGDPAPQTYLWGNTKLATWILSAQTGADGAFTMGPLLPGEYSLVAHGWEDADSEPVEAKGGDEGVVLRLRAGGIVRGTVVDKLSGKTSRAEITYSVNARTDKEIGMLDSQEDGTFKVSGLEPGTYDLAARASGSRVGVLRGITVQAAIETRDLVVILEPGATLRLRYAGKKGYLQYRVVSEGTVIAGDGLPAGATSETAVPPGRIVVECGWPDAQSEKREVEVSAGEHKELVFGGG
jgi:hypothetical protein